MKIANPQRVYFALLVGAALQVYGAGCVGLDTKPSSISSTPPNFGGVICQVQSTWESQLLFTNDTEHNGRPVPGLAGRVFLFGPDMKNTLRGKGIMVVDLYDTQQLGKDGNPKLLQRWNIDKVSLDQLFRQQFLGWGYTLFLPWPEYQPSVKRVIVQVGYHPEKGSPVFGSRSELTLHNEPLQRSERMIVPGAGLKNNSFLEGAAIVSPGTR